MKKRQVWTMGYFPMIMGGDIHQPMITKVKAIAEMPIGKGFKAFSFKTPKGTIRIAESVTGAIVGDSFEEVIADVKFTTKKVMEKQIADAKKTLKGSVKHYEEEKFFQIYHY